MLEDIHCACRWVAIVHDCLHCMIAILLDEDAKDIPLAVVQLACGPDDQSTLDTVAAPLRAK